MFFFDGVVESSKSLVNRALIVQSYNPQISLNYLSHSRDVLVLEKSLHDLKKGLSEFDCEDAGTAFRFLVLRLSRERGRWRVKGNERLLSRPQTGLLTFLEERGVSVVQDRRHWDLQSQGWGNESFFKIEAHQSSQFLSSVLLNSWQRDVCTEITQKGDLVSEGYFRMTKELLRFFGMEMQETAEATVVKARQSPQTKLYTAEADVSSCFSLASCAVQNGSVRIQNFPTVSWQPDLLFLELFNKMGIPFSQKGQELIVEKASHIGPIDVDLCNTPDLFPVLAVVCARADGVSHLSGVDQLRGKESDRLQNTIFLLERLGRRVERVTGAIKIYGDSAHFRAVGDFDPDQDHRMAMACQVANFYGAQLKILTPHVVNKSFPQFWQSIGVVQ